jgi:peptidoglycan/xylan/chitin deacetylase (PgdA/CDA1 family)
MGHASSWLGLYRQRFAPCITIVAFHRINDERPENGLTCSSALFASFCKLFRDHFRVVSLAEQVEACHKGSVTGGTFSMTLDDGYLGNLEVAADILKRFELRATIFGDTGLHQRVDSLIPRSRSPEAT